MRVLHGALIAAVIAALGCGNEGSEPVAEGPPPAPPPAAYEVHEWGFIAQATAPGQMQAMVAGPGHYSPSVNEALEALMGNQLGESFGFGGLGLRGGKPVLYIHLAPGTDAVTFSATVSLPASGGQLTRFAEHFPPAEMTRAGDGSQLRWTGVRATAVGAVDARYPTPTSTACQNLPDGYCEAAELPRYQTTDAAALRIGTATYNHLFYRADLGGELPLRVTIEGERVTARNAGPEAIPGRILRIVRESSSAATKVLVFDPPAPGASTEVAPPVELGPNAALEVLRGGLRDLGMTQSESDVFLVAWREMLLGADEATAAAGPVVQVGQPPAALRPKCDSLVYFLPQAAVDRAVPLTFDPPPRAVRRAILAQVELPTVVGHGGGAGEGQGGGPPPVIASRVTIDDVAVRGSLPPEVVRRVVRRHVNEVRFCYEQGLRLRPTPPRGRVPVTFIVAATGIVQSAEVRATTLGDTGIQQCIAGAVRRWTFPAGGGVAVVDLAFGLEPAP